MMHSAHARECLNMKELKPLVPQFTLEERAQVREMEEKWAKDDPKWRSNRFSGGYYDIDGTPITLAAWAVAMEKATRIDGGRHVGLTILDNGYKVSTVWLGLEHSFGDGPPLIFESMVFHPVAVEVTLIPGSSRKFKYHPDKDQDRYTTLEQARTGHMLMCEKWRDAQPTLEGEHFERAMAEARMDAQEFHKAMVEEDTS